MIFIILGSNSVPDAITRLRKSLLEEECHSLSFHQDPGQGSLLMLFLNCKMQASILHAPFNMSSIHLLVTNRP